MQTYTGSLQIKTVHIEAADHATYIDVLLANTLFVNPCIDIVPFSPSDGSLVDFRYHVRVYWQGAILETHTFTSVGQLNVASMSYPNKVFPPNQAWKTIPQLKGYEPRLPGFQVTIINNESTPRDFTIYSTCQLLSTAVFKKLE